MSNFAEYPRPSAGQDPSPYGRGPGVYFEAIGESFELVKQDLGHWAAATIVYFAVGFALSFPVSLAMQAAMPRIPVQAETGFIVAVFAIQLLINLLIAAVQSCLLVGMILMGIRKSRGEYINVGMVFEPLQKIGTIIGSNLLYYLIVYASILACVVPAFYFIPVLFLMPVVAFMKDMTPMQALKTTFNACKPYWAGLFGLGFIGGLLILVGGCACLVGVLVTFPMYCVIFAIHYRAFFESGLAPDAAVWR